MMTSLYEVRTAHGVTLATVRPGTLAMSIIVAALRDYLETDVVFDLIEPIDSDPTT